MKSINFDSGIREYAINGDENNVLRIAVTDLNLGKRIENMLEKLEEIAEKYKDSEISPDTLYNLDIEVKAMLDEALGEGTSSIFKGVNVCSPVGNGEFMIKGFLDALSEIIMEEQSKLKKPEPRAEVQKYLINPSTAPQKKVELTEAEYLELLAKSK